MSTQSRDLCFQNTPELHKPLRETGISERVRWTTFTIFCCLYLGLFFLAQRPPQPERPYFFSRVVDLTDARTAMTASMQGAKVPPERLIVSAIVFRAGRQVSMQDLARYERTHGQIPSGAVAFARSSARCVEFTAESVEFLVGARNISGVASNAGCVRAQSERVSTAHLYELTNVSGLDALPESGATAVIAPMKTDSGLPGPVRILALVQ